MRHGARGDLAILIGALLLASACATPVGVVRGNPQSVYRALTSSVLSTGEPSATTAQVLHRHGVATRFEDEPEAVLEALRGTGVGLSRDRLFALAELSFAHADREKKREYYLAAAVYAYAFLLPDEPPPDANPIDPRMRLAADFYNLGLTLGLSAPDDSRVILETGDRTLSFGRLELTVDPTTFNWSGYRMSRFVPVAEFEVRGLANRYRQPGVGAPLAAELTPLGEGPEAQAARKRIPPRIKVPVTAFVRLDNAEAGIASGVVRGRIELYPADEFTAVEVAGMRLPLELEPTATLAYMLEGAPVWDTEFGGFLRPGGRSFGDGLSMINPYRRGRIPVVLIHGTASSPARWAALINELQNDPVLRERVQFWLFMYDTSNPILLSAKRLRDALTSVLAEVDPEGRDPALREMVLIGHSQGGLLTRLMVTDSGSHFWDNVSTQPLADMTMTPEVRELLQTSMFFEPLPFVNRVIFICTPHQGSYRVTGMVLNLVRWLVRLPKKLAKDVADIRRQNPDAVSMRTLGDIPTAVDNMRPGQPFVRTLSASPIAPGVTVNSIVAVLGEGPISGRGDGVVMYTSAHLEGVGTEKIVHSGHSTQAVPETIEEVRRILREQVAPP